MSDDYKDLEWAVELGRVALFDWCDDAYETAVIVVAALAEPLRQSQRVEELEQRARANLHAGRLQVHELTERIKELEAALRFYADERNWSELIPPQRDTTVMDNDRGIRARTARP
jgi:hypothetical protein